MSVVSILKSWALVIESGVNCLRSREQANKGLKVIPLFDFFFSAYHYCFSQLPAILHIATETVLLNRKDFLKPAV